jgi:hypothetical protein
MNPYKISTYVLLTALVILFIYSCDKRASPGAALQSASDEPNGSMISEDHADSLRREKPHRDTGERIDYATAWTHLDRYKLVHGIQCNTDSPDPRQIYGYTFGMNKFKAFADELIRLDVSNPDSLLGVRIYLSTIAAKNPYTGRMENRNDLFLIPVGKSGRSVYPVDDCDLKESILADDGLILNTSMPCPNRCQ